MIRKRIFASGEFGPHSDCHRVQAAWANENMITTYPMSGSCLAHTTIMTRTWFGDTWTTSSHTQLADKGKNDQTGDLDSQSTWILSA